jgi:hypothetical protein
MATIASLVMFPLMMQSLKSQVVRIVALCFAFVDGALRGGVATSDILAHVVRDSNGAHCWLLGTTHVVLRFAAFSHISALLSRVKIQMLFVSLQTM